MKLGIEKFDFYAGQFSLDIKNLVAARGGDQNYIDKTLLCRKRSVYPICEDSVSLAVNAAKNMLSDNDKKDIDLLIVGTESSLDFGKPISNWVHEYLGLESSCRNFEIKHACYSGTAALRMALSWLASSARPGKKALVINTDISRSHLGSSSEYICGGCSTALLLSHQPNILSYELGSEGTWTSHVYDTYRPTSDKEVGNSQMSLFSYLDSLDGSVEMYEQINGDLDIDRLPYHIFHAPFPGMTKEAFSSLVRSKKKVSKSEVHEMFMEKVYPGLELAQQIGSAYGASTFLGLISLIKNGQFTAERSRISVFSYGSGCQGEFYHADVQEGAQRSAETLNVNERLDSRVNLSVKEYEECELARTKLIDQRDFSIDMNAILSAYEGKELLVLRDIKNYERSYEWT